MELNAEQIKKALEYCTSKFCFEGEGCPLVDVGGHYDIDECTKELVKNALALISEQEERIKELTEENERLRGIGLPDDETYIKLSDAKHAIMNYVGEQTVSKYASSEVCKAVRNGAEGAMNELDYITPANVAPIADTIEDIKLRFAMRFGTYTDKDMTPITEVFRLLYQSQKRCWRRKHRR